METVTIAAWLATRIGPGRMKQATVAREIRVAQSMVSRWIRGEAIPGPENCRRLARLFGEPETTVLAMAGHLSAAGAPLPQRSLTDLATELAARIRERESGQAGSSTIGPYAAGQSSATMGGTRQHGRIYSASAPSLAAVLTLVAEWGVSMGDEDLLMVRIEGDYLLPGIRDQEQIVLSLARRGEPGERVLARVDGQVITGRIAVTAGERRLAIDGGSTIALNGVRVLAVIVGWLHPEPPRPEAPSEGTAQ